MYKNDISQYFMNENKCNMIRIPDLMFPKIQINIFIRVTRH